MRYTATKPWAEITFCERHSQFKKSRTTRNRDNHALAKPLKRCGEKWTNRWCELPNEDPEVADIVKIEATYAILTSDVNMYRIAAKFRDPAVDSWAGEPPCGRMSRSPLTGQSETSFIGAFNTLRCN